MPLSLPITSLTAIFAAALLLALTFRVIGIRRRDGVVLGDNGDRVLTKAIRGQANAAEQLPIALIILGLAEMQGTSTWMLGVLALTLMIGRLMHAAYFAFHGTNWRFRFWGMSLTMVSQGGLIALLALTQLT